MQNFTCTNVSSIFYVQFQQPPKSPIQKKFVLVILGKLNMCMLNIHIEHHLKRCYVTYRYRWVRFPILPVVMGNRSCQQTEVCPSTLALRGGGFCQYCKCPRLNMTICMVYCRYNMYMFSDIFFERERVSEWICAMIFTYVNTMDSGYLYRWYMYTCYVDLKKKRWNLDDEFVSFWQVRKRPRWAFGRRHHQGNMAGGFVTV